MTMDDIRFFAATDVGNVREHNEDNFLVDKKLSLFMVADGMGGHAAGEVASAIAVRTIHEEIKREKERTLRSKIQTASKTFSASHSRSNPIRGLSNSYLKLDQGDGVESVL